MSKIATYNFKQVHIQPTDPNYIHKVLKFKIDFGHGNLSLTKISEKTKKEYGNRKNFDMLKLTLTNLNLGTRLQEINSQIQWINVDKTNHAIPWIEI